MRIRIFPYRGGSRSAKALRDEFRGLGHDAKLIRRENSRYRPSVDDLIINWGASTMPDALLNSGAHILNHPSACAAASSKLTTLRHLEEAEVPHVPFTTDTAVALSWHRDGSGVYARTLDRGHAGDGCHFIPPDVENVESSNWVNAPLYTKQGVGREYRVHVVGTKVVRIQKRYKENDDHPIRSHDNGYTFILEGFRRPRGLKSAAIYALNALGLEFGAVDLVNAQTTGGDRRPRVLEVNTAVGMDGTTPNEYARTILEEFSDQGVDPITEPAEERDHRDDEDEVQISSRHRQHLLTAERSVQLGRTTCGFCGQPLYE